MPEMYHYVDVEVIMNVHIPFQRKTVSKVVKSARYEDLDAMKLLVKH